MGLARLNMGVLSAPRCGDTEEVPMSFVKYPVTALLVGLSFGCAPAPPAVDLDAERKKLEEAVDAYNAAASAKDVDKIVTLYTSDAIILPPDTPEATGTAG